MKVETDNICIYCGELATSIDHVPPQSVRPFISADPRLKEQYPFLEVPCCHDCNSRLTDYAAWSIDARKKLLIEKLKRKHKKLLKAPIWSSEDLKELGETLQTRIVQSGKRQRRIRARLNTLKRHQNTQHASAPASYLDTRVTSRLTASPVRASLKTDAKPLPEIKCASDRAITLGEIQRQIAEHYNIRLADMYSSTRQRAIARPRQIAMYLARQHTSLSLSEIGRKFGGRDHTTVIHAIETVVREFNLTV